MRSATGRTCSRALLASRGVNRRFGTAPPHGRAETKRLAQWLVLVGLLVLVGYGSRIGAGKPDPQVLYRWSTAIGGFVQDAVVLAIVLAIARHALPALALRPPRSFWLAVLFVAAAVVAIYLFEAQYAQFVDPGNEQGLTPDRWEPSHAVTYVVNAVVICTWVPFVEELTYRGLGYSLLERFGKGWAILSVGILFGLAHGLVLSLPVLVVFGCALAWVRAETDSVLPGMIAHALFNAVALVAAVTIGS
jgi:membrane protease YdiL (CAAX protease family)